MPRRVLIFAMAFPPAAAGTGISAYALAHGLASHGEEVLVLAPAALGAAAFDVEQDFAVERFAASALVPWRYVRARQRLLRAIRRFKPDCVWATNGMATRVAGLLYCWQTVPLISSMRGTDVTTRLVGRNLGAQLEGMLQHRAYRASAAIAAVSRYVSNSCYAASDKGTACSLSRCNSSKAEWSA